MIADNRKSKISFVFLGFGFLFSLVLIKAVYVQVVNKDKLLKYSQSQIVRYSKVYPNRGNIYDRNGASLAINEQTYSIFTIPKYVNKKISYRRLANLIPHLTYSKILKIINKRKKYTWIARKIFLSKKNVQKIKTLSPGIYIEAVPQRVYPNHELASQLIGFVGIDNVGLAGIEHTFDKYLKGKPRVIKYHKDAKGRPVRHQSMEVGQESESLYLTIDKEIQSVAEKYLKEAVVEFNATKGGVGIIDASNGEIIAMANYPSFDPNKLQKSVARNRRLSFISDPFEPGSVFKTFTAASALEFKMATSDTNYYCERGLLKLNGHTIKEAEAKEKFEWLSLSDIIRVSSNIGTTKIAFDLTFPRLKKTLYKFRIGRKTNIELPGESRGIFTNHDNISPLSLSNISFGQGVATTGIQILSAYAAIVNGGFYFPPTLIKDQNKSVKPERILSEHTTESLKDMLVSVVEDGTGSRAKIPYFTVGGKTSTAQRPDSIGGYNGYVPGFVGFVLNTGKQYVTFVYIDNPKSKAYYGNQVAAPVFKKINQYLLYRNKDIKGLAYQPKSVNQIFDRVHVKQAAKRTFGRNSVPNFIGLDKKSSVLLAKKAKINLKISHIGRGLVVRQSPSYKENIKKYKKVVLYYEPPSYD